jgi:hypothetical protein
MVLRLQVVEVVEQAFRMQVVLADLVGVVLAELQVAEPDQEQQERLALAVVVGAEQDFLNPAAQAAPVS